MCLRIIEQPAIFCGSNTAIGVQALYTNYSGLGNTGLGNSADVGSINQSFSTAVGYNAIVSTGNKVRVGNTAVTVIEGQVDWTFPSDAQCRNNNR